jgi:3',5'-nucleoside bisphosphate phosphatase
MNKTIAQPFWADLHCHTQASDGLLEPAQLAEMAKACGLKGLSITDHDTIAAYPDAIKAAKRLGLHLGAGIEFSCVFKEHDIHLLGYDFKLDSPAIEALCKRHQVRRHYRNVEMIEKLGLEGFDISEKEVEEEGKGDTVGRPHIAQVMVKKKYVASIKEAFNRYLGEGKRCYARGDVVTVDETIDVIHNSGGKAFIAHPHLLFSTFPVEDLLTRPFDGIECRYGNLSKKQSAVWVTIAEKKGWLMSGGSDFHGLIKPDISLGCSGVEESTFFKIFERPLT